MTTSPDSRKRRSRRRLSRRFTRFGAAQYVIVSLLRSTMWLATRLGRRRTETVTLALGRILGPALPENRTAARNIALAFPEKSEAEQKAILRGCWANFAKVIAEFVFLEELADGFDPENPEESEIVVSGIDQFLTLRDRDRPTVIVAAHLANWEVLGVVAAKFGLKTIMPFRAPTNAHLAKDVIATRERLMGRLVPNNRGAALHIVEAMENGLHLGMLVDQRLGRGKPVPFLGRPAMTNPLAAKLARNFDCPVHGARAIRLPDGKLHLELTPEIDMPRDEEGLIDVPAAMVRINELVEGWVREHPEQWFWLHDRWKM